MLILSRKKNQQIIISEDISITIVEIDNDKVKIGIDAPKNVKIFRKELIDGVKDSNTESSEISIQALEELKEKIFYKKN